MQGLSSSSSSSSSRSNSSSSSSGSDSYCVLPSVSAMLSPTTLSPTALSSASLSLSPTLLLPCHPRQAKKRLLAVSEDPTEALVEHVKKCRVSSTPGELRLKRDLVDCDVLHQQGVARFDKTPGNPLECQLTFLCPIGGGGVGVAAPAGGISTRGIRVPTTFSIVVPKFYPHDPPAIFADRFFRRTCPFVGGDGQLQLPFLERAAWSSVSTMAFVVETLLQGLRKYAAGEPQPWRIASEAAELDAVRLDEAGSRTQNPEEEQHAAGGTCFASPSDHPPSLSASAGGVRRDGGGNDDEWAVESPWNAMQLDRGGDGNGSGGGSGGGTGSGALSGTPAVFGREAVLDCGETPAGFGQEAVLGCRGAGISARGSLDRVTPAVFTPPGFGQGAVLGCGDANSDGCMDVADSL